MTKIKGDVPRGWVPDSQLASFEQLELELPGALNYPGEPKKPVVATLVRQRPPQGRPAVLYVHGWSDYFFQVHLAELLDGLGYDFYALDLRRYGRSLRQGQLAGYTHDLAEYFTEIDLALAEIQVPGQPKPVLMGHSTGGPISALYTGARPDALSALVLNAPWLEFQGYPALRTTLHPVLSAIGSLSPTSVLPVTDNELYLRATSVTHEGNWDYNLNLKGDKAFLIRTGWLSAVMTGQALVAAGLGIEIPVLVATSDRSDFSRRWKERLRRADIVLDVERIASRVSCLGSFVTLAKVTGAMHDLALSDEPARSCYFDVLRRWLVAFGPMEATSR